MPNNLRAKQWSFTTRTNTFSVLLEGNHDNSQMTLRVYVTDEDDGYGCSTTDYVLPSDKLLRVTVPNKLKAGDMVRAKFYLGNELVDTMSISVCGAKCPKCGEEFTL